MSDHGFSIEVPEGYDEAVIRTRLAMKSEGFSILTEMHVGGMLGPEQGDERQYLIMGIYNAAVSSKRIDSDLQVAVHLPCNFVVQETAGRAMVAALDPQELVAPDQTPIELIEGARSALLRTLEKVADPAPW
ncbi:MAG: DUF302 domain-containing protein [Actinomycetota bacterium]|nr:DUF302 domain-containing protein [Actinomycetota bacterium]